MIYLPYKKYMSKILPSLFLFILLLLPNIAPAQAALVSCSGLDCSICNLVDMANTGIIGLLGFIFMIFAVLMTIAGFGLVTSGGNQSALDAAKKKFQNAIIGLLIVMAAWLFVDTIMHTLLKGNGDLTVFNTGSYSGWGPWSDVQCIPMTETVPAPPGTGMPPVPVEGFYYQFYEQDLTNNCKIARAGRGVDLPTCSTKEASAIAAARGDTYVVYPCDPDATIPVPPSWSTMQACATENTACKPLTPYVGVDPLGVEWTGADPNLKQCVLGFAGSLGTPPIQSAYRPQAYQDHIKEVHTKWCAQGLSVNSDPNCSAVKTTVGNEMSKHGLSCARPVASVSNHTSGRAVDISPTPPKNPNDYCLDWFGSKDPVHYTLKPNCSCP